MNRHRAQGRAERGKVKQLAWGGCEVPGSNMLQQLILPDLPWHCSTLGGLLLTTTGASGVLMSSNILPPNGHFPQQPPDQPRCLTPFPPCSATRFSSHHHGHIRNAQLHQHTAFNSAPPFSATPRTPLPLTTTGTSKMLSPTSTLPSAQPRCRNPFSPPPPPATPSATHHHWHIRNAQLH